MIRKMVNNPKFQTALKQKIGSKIDTSELDKEKVVLNKQLQQSIKYCYSLIKCIQSLQI